MTIGERIRKIRQENGLSQKELGKKLNVSQQMIGQWETGKSNPKIETLKRIADTLDVGLWEIVELDQMDLDTRIQEIKKMVSLLTPEGLEEFDRLVTEALNENPASIQKEREEAAIKAPRFTDKAESTKKTSKLFARNKKENIVKDGKPPKFTTYSTTYAPQEAYELLHSLINEEGIDDRRREEVSQQLKKILGSFKGLNEIGRKKAVERIEELYMIPKYIFGNSSDKIDEPPQE